MNIFALDNNPKAAAQYHVDKHVIKMILEHCQLLCTAHRILDGEFYEGRTANNRKIKRWRLSEDLEDFIYKATHINHPSAVWARANLSHYTWLASMTDDLCKEYTYRYGKVHKCERDGLVKWLNDNTPKNIVNDGTFVLPTPAMPDHCKVPGDVVASYRNYYAKEKQRMHSWSGKIAGRPTPTWLQEHTS